MKIAYVYKNNGKIFKNIIDAMNYFNANSIYSSSFDTKILDGFKLDHWIFYRLERIRIEEEK